MQFTIPERMGDMTGAEFASTLSDMPANAARDLAIYQQFELGNVPSFMREPVTLRVSDAGHVVEYGVLPDVLCIGTDDNFVRVPMMPMTAQKVARLFAGSLITPFLSDQVWNQAAVRIDPMTVTMPPTVSMTSTKWFIDQNAKIEAQRQKRPGLIAGHKKDIVLTNNLLEPQFSDRVAIYGWHLLTGSPIQGLNPSRETPRSHTHERSYVDYSHGVRLVSQDCLLDGEERDILEIMQEPSLARLFNGKYGPLQFTRYEE